MFQLLLFAALCFASGNAYMTKIVNGSFASLGEFPYIVSIQIYGKHNCGGSIIDATHILTAAHCLVGFESIEFYIQYGVVDLNEKQNRIKVSDRLYHHGFSKSHGFFDIAILTLEEPIKFDENTKPTNLPNAWDLTPEPNTVATLAGWGLEYSGSHHTAQNLEKVDLVIFSDDECESIYDTEMQTNSEIQICSGAREGGKGQCSGDSGGPLYANGTQVGLVSWSLKPCGRKGLPGVFTKVSMYIRWINEHIQNGTTSVSDTA